MGRKRRHIDPEEPLPAGLYKQGRKFRARLLGGPWVYFGDDYATAMAGYAAWCRSRGDTDTVGWLLDLFTTTVCAGHVKAGRLKPRTARDYRRDAIVLKKGLGHFPLRALKPRHIVTYRDTRAQGAPGHVRNELACLSAALAYAVESGRLDRNPALEVARPARGKRLRLITDDEYLAVFERAIASVRIAMRLAIRTLALPSDVLALGPRNVVKLADGGRVLRYRRQKTGTLIEVELVGDLAQLVDDHLAQPVVRRTFVYTAEGKPYTVGGIGAMFRRYCVGTKERPLPEGQAVRDFGLRDLRAKGATDEYRAGRSIRSLQHLLGHRSVQTTEIYLKSLVPERVKPNERAIVAEAK